MWVPRLSESARKLESAPNSASPVDSKEPQGSFLRWHSRKVQAVSALLLIGSGVLITIAALSLAGVIKLSLSQEVLSVAIGIAVLFMTVSVALMIYSYKTHPQSPNSSVNEPDANLVTGDILEQEAYLVENCFNIVFVSLR